MSGFKDLAKGGWHPKGKDGKSKESWRGDNKGINTVAGWMGKGKDPNQESREHVSAPLKTLKDPYAFGPPPKNVNYHGGAALPNQTTPDTRGLGQPLSREENAAKQKADEEEARREADEAAKPKGPPVPFRSDTSGLSTAHLPPPPGRKDGADGRTTIASSEPESLVTSKRLPPAEAASKSKPPGLPPRLPPRQNSSPMPSPPPALRSKPPRAEPDIHKGILNQNSLSKLGASGISVPGFGIGGGKEKQSPTVHSPPATSQSPVNTPAQASHPQLSELQSRFSRLSSKSSKPEGPSQGTTFAEKQAALKTANSFRNDPGSVSLSDARSAASTANSFRERHGEQVKSGWQSANNLNTKYGIADKIGAAGAERTAQSLAPPQALEPEHANSGYVSPPTATIAAKKKPPPPPPKKKPALAGSSIDKEPDLPPPIPLSSKPKPGVSGYY